MSTLEEQIDIGVPMEVAWDCLHRVETYSQFLEGVREARSGAGTGRTWTSTRAAGLRSSKPRSPTTARKT